MIKLLVHPFYRSNAGFFLFWAFLLYGGRQGHELIDFYYAIIMAQLKSPLFLTLSLLIWTLYHFKSFIFLRNSIVNYLPTWRCAPQDRTERDRRTRSDRAAALRSPAQRTPGNRALP